MKALTAEQATALEVFIASRASEWRALANTWGDIGNRVMEAELSGKFWSALTILAEFRRLAGGAE